ncbi:DUF2188 domain-containing protein [Microlunatus parietis]|uniref:DUF2188 domain-containing protein n=1 Tax=Microlunatus parietis TaxID=682979 RepID=A0A7Y9I7T4_9ACTN|nr:DUF2188 domain-containing protein [Microlunatus parietis]NYE71571.1 hypothetical protein [Microlunatus parietis]
MAETEFHVVPRAAHWEVVQEGQVREVFNSKELAIAAARDLAGEESSARVVVHGADAQVIEDGDRSSAAEAPAGGATAARAEREQP